MVEVDGLRCVAFDFDTPEVAVEEVAALEYCALGEGAVIEPAPQEVAA